MGIEQSRMFGKTLMSACEEAEHAGSAHVISFVERRVQALATNDAELAQLMLSAAKAYKSGNCRGIEKVRSLMRPEDCKKGA